MRHKHVNAMLEGLCLESWAVTTWFVNDSLTDFGALCSCPPLVDVIDFLGSADTRAYQDILYRTGAWVKCTVVVLDVQLLLYGSTCFHKKVIFLLLN